MKKEFEAYFSKSWAWIFAILSLLFLFGIIMFSIFWIPVTSLGIIITLSVVFLIFVYVFVITIRKNGVAVEVTDDKLILHKKEIVEIPITDILIFSIHDGDGSFDISIKTSTAKYSMHCFIKEQRQKKNQLIILLKSKGIKVVTFDLGGGD